MNGITFRLKRKLASYKDGQKCSHLELIQPVDAMIDGCPECLEVGDSWVHLRQCLVCGQVGCCDSSKNKHASRHYVLSGHPLIRSLEPGENWRWCYIDQVLLEG